MFKFIRNAINEFKEGFKEGQAKHAKFIVHSVPSATRAYNFEKLAASMLTQYGMDADIYVADNVTNAPMCVISTRDLGLLNIEMTTKNSSVLVIDRNAMGVQAWALPAHSPIFENLDIRDIATIILAHELGHIARWHVHSSEHQWKRELLTTVGVHGIKDHKLDFIKAGQLTIAQEYEAWDTGRQYVPAHLVDAYEAFNDINISSYNKLFNTQLGEEYFR